MSCARIAITASLVNERSAAARAIAADPSAQEVSRANPAAGAIFVQEIAIFPACWRENAIVDRL
ncbi:hypothetical protein ASE49_07605 [Novosphingobium sp. Leaf2]|nr:hypothetical protein ASE49_07605 [Novosphingobium sp. Leaf2]